MEGKGREGKGKEGKEKGTKWELPGTIMHNLAPGPIWGNTGFVCVSKGSLQPTSVTSGCQISSHRHVHSATTITLLVLYTGIVKFIANGPTSWNSLPLTLCTLHLSHNAFEWDLKTHLFSIARHHWGILRHAAPFTNVQTYVRLRFICKNPISFRHKNWLQRV